MIINTLSNKVAHHIDILILFALKKRKK